MQSPHIVRYIDGYLTTDFLCIVMQYCPNGDLEAVIKNQLQARSYLNEKVKSLIKHRTFFSILNQSYMQYSTYIRILLYIEI